MRLGIFAFLLGILYCQTLPELPNIYWLVLVLPIGIFPRYRLIFWFALGLGYAIWRADIILAQKIPAEIIGKNIKIIGTIINFPNQHRFQFSPEPSQEWLNPGIIYLKYLEPSLLPGQKWQFTVRLKSARATFNPDSFASETWLFQHRIMASGSVISAKLLQQPALININNLRYSLAQTIKEELDEYQSVGIIIALALGDKSLIPSKQKEILQHTGIVHLIAISGLHIGFIAWLVFIISRTWWKYMGNMPLLFPAPRFAALASMFFATCYALLAGFSLPTQRALIMVMVALFGITFNYKIATSKIFAIALLLILLLDPLTVLAVEFWLSFGTVAIIFYSLSSRQAGITVLEKYGLSIIKIQIVITLGLFPILLFIFGYIPLLSFAANLIAIPWVSFVVVPCTLLGIILLPLTDIFLHIAAITFDAILVPISWLADLDWNLWYHQPSLLTMLVAMLGIFILLLPSGFPARWLGFIWLLPLFFNPQSTSLKPGELWFTLLDVGQGLAAVIRTQNHVLLYDTGPSPYIGKTVIVPFLRARDIQHIDKIMISHVDKDHSGGIKSVLSVLSVDELIINHGKNYNDGIEQILKMLSIDKILTNTIHKYSKNNIYFCQANQNWSWDGVSFQVLHPAANFKSKNTNDTSCVLKITTNNNTILLPGDISKDIELQLIANYKSNLAADILVAPHHGSENSSSISFINAVRPKITLFSTGYNNSFKHPRAKIVQRYKNYQALTWNTAESGAINLYLTANGIFGPSEARKEKQRYWYD